MTSTIVAPRSEFIPPLTAVDDPRFWSVTGLPLFIDSTMISTARSCLYRFYNEFVLCLRPNTKSIDLHAGGVFAKALEVFYEAIFVRGKSVNDALLLAEAAFVLEWGDFEIYKDTPKTPDRMWAALVEYVAKYPPHSDLIQPFFIEGLPTFEFRFAIPLDEATTGLPFPLHPSGEPFIYSGRFDMLGTYINRPAIRDEKTTKSIGNSWAEQWDLRSQFIGYTWAAQTIGIPCDTVLIRGVGILKKSIVLVEALKVYRPHIVQRWLYQLYRDLIRIRQAWDENYWDLNLAESCTQYGGCMFRELTSTADPLPWRANYKRVRWDPLARENRILVPEPSLEPSPEPLNGS